MGETTLASFTQKKTTKTRRKVDFEVKNTKNQ